MTRELGNAFHTYTPALFNHLVIVLADTRVPVATARPASIYIGESFLYVLVTVKTFYILGNCGSLAMVSRMVFNFHLSCLY